MIREAKFDTLITVADRPTVNMMTNPNAWVDLTDAAGRNCTLLRQSPFGGPGNAPYGTAFRLNAGASNDSSFTIGGDAGGIRLGLEAGKTYTVRGTIYLDGVLGGSINARARRIVVFTKNGTDPYVETSSAQAPNAAGETDLSVTFTMPANPTEAFIRIYHGHSAGTLYWYRLRLSEGTETDFFDGETFNDRELGTPEHGWDNTPGKSTSWRIPDDGTILEDAEFDQISYDRKRVPFIDATISLPYTEEAWALLDPRVARDVILYFNVQHYTRTGNGPLTTHVSHLPYRGIENSRGKLWLREAARDYVNETIRLRAQSGEVRFEDKKRIAGTVLDTGATTAEELWDYALTDVGESSARGSVSGYAVLGAIPAGDRRLWMQGESASSIFESELAALPVACRSYCDDVGVFIVDEITRPPGFLLSPFAVESGDDGTIILAETTLSREDGWADATLVRAEYIDGGGTRQTQYQRFPADGVNRAGKVATQERAIAGSYIAENYTVEASRAGITHRLTVAADFRITPGRDVDVTLATGETFTIEPNTVTHRIRDGITEIEGYDTQ